MSGKGDSPRPLSVDQETFASNWARAFNKQDNCEYSGLPSTASYQDEPPKEYAELLASGKFWELFPGLTGNWNEDKSRWLSIALIKEMGNK
jgi:hypothetical protein